MYFPNQVQRLSRGRALARYLGGGSAPCDVHGPDRLTGSEPKPGRRIDTSQRFLGKFRVAGVVILTLAALTCGSTFLYATRISSRNPRRGEIFLVGMGASLAVLTAGFRLVRPSDED